MTSITYRIHLDDPAIFSALAGDPNSAVSYPYIPGSVIRGMVIGRYIRQHGDIKHTDDQQHLFFSSKTRYLNAYPLINDQRSLPVPATWSSRKYKTGQDNDDTITDTALKRFPAGVKPKAVSGFTVLSGDQVTLYKPQILFNVHTARARRDASEQQVFRYEALADGQTFMGAIQCAEADAATLLELLQADAHIAIGGSRTAGYGSATLSDVQQSATWQEVQHNTTADPLVLTFLSDTLVRDEHGVYNPTPKVLQAALARLGIACELDAISLRTTWVGGFNRKWGLPLPQCIAIERGSVLRLRNLQAEEQALANLYACGIGERLEDGFGRVALGWQRQPTLTPVKYEQTPVTSNVQLSEASAELWQRISQRIATDSPHEQLTRTLYGSASQDAARYRIRGNGLSRTQIARLRTVIANAVRADASTQQTAIGKFLTKIEGKAAGRQFRNARIGRQSLSDWLREPTFPGVSGLDEADQRTRLELIDLILERAQREQDSQAQQKGN